MPTEEELPPMCRQETNPDSFHFDIFKILRDYWQASNPSLPLTELARLLGEPKQRVTQWYTRSGEASPPPWWVLMRMCSWYGLCVVVSPAGGQLCRDPKSLVVTPLLTVAPKLAESGEPVAGESAG